MTSEVRSYLAVPRRPYEQPHRRQSNETIILDSGGPCQLEVEEECLGNQVGKISDQVGPVGTVKVENYEKSKDESSSNPTMALTRNVK